MQDSKPVKWLLRLIWTIVPLLAFIGVAMVIRRALILAGMSSSFNPAGGPPFDDGISSRPLLTIVHILPGALFMVLGPLQFMRGLRARYPGFHRWSGHLFIICGYLIGLTALIMSFLTPIGGANESTATILFALLFLIALTQALRYILRKNISLHREWMVRAFAIGLAVGTVRPIVGMFFAFSGLAPQVFFGTAFWLGFTLHLVAAEVWINYTRR